MKKLLVAAVAAGLVGTVNAQSAFEGAFGQIGIGYENVAPSLSLSNLSVTGSGSMAGSYPYSSSISNSNSFTGAVAVGYYFPVSKDFLLGIGAEYNPITGESANWTASNATLGNVNGNWKKQNSYNIFLSPATPIGKDGLLYGKVGFTGASVKSSDGIDSTTTNLTGFSLGAGYKQIISGGFYGFGEVNYANYGNKTTTQTSSTAGYNLSQSSTFSANTFNVMVGVGYKF
jgi:outer membrane immunogenic protein